MVGTKDVQGNLLCGDIFVCDINDFLWKQT